jgi:hypothetical protein
MSFLIAASIAHESYNAFASFGWTEAWALGGAVGGALIGLITGLAFRWARPLRSWKHVVNHAGCGMIALAGSGAIAGAIGGEIDGNNGGGVWIIGTVIPAAIWGGVMIWRYQRARRGA